VSSNGNAPAVVGRVGEMSESNLVTWLLAAFVAWMPLQTPVALVAYQYLHVSTTIAQGILLTKDVWAAGLFLVLLARHYREIRFRWADRAALAYAAFVLIYSVVPATLGSHLPALAVVASARELVMPIELYGLGRLAFLAGVSPVGMVKVFLGVAAAAAVFSVGAFAFLPGHFWESTYNLVGFVHDVQGITVATSLWSASLVGAYGDSGLSLRAMGPFTHPVGTGVYFAAPFLLALCAAWTTGLRRKGALAVAAVGALLFAFAVITPISRGIWIGCVGAIVVSGVVLHRYRLGAVTAVALVLFLVLVPPFSYSIRGAATGTDGSAIAHSTAIDHGLSAVSGNILGSGVGNGDQWGTVYAAAAGADAAGVGENMYLTIYASIGPLGFLAFIVWLGALLLDLLVRRRPSMPTWVLIGVGAGLLAEAGAAMTASTLMRYTTAASLWLLVGLILAVPSEGLRLPDRAELKHPRRWLGLRRAPAAPPDPGS
jgi:hypothetical protein